jgi:hypothetical protein
MNVEGGGTVPAEGERNGLLPPPPPSPCTRPHTPHAFSLTQGHRRKL